MKNFTLTELGIVIAILLILAGVIIPNVVGLTKKEQANETEILPTLLPPAITVSIPSYPTRIVQIDEATPLTTIPDSYGTWNISYFNDFWDEVSKDIVFLDGNMTANIYLVGVYWEKKGIVCDEIWEQSKAGFNVSDRYDD